MPKEIEQYKKHRVYNEWIMKGCSYEELAAKFKMSENSVMNILNEKLKSDSHKAKVKRIREEAGRESYVEEKTKEVDLIPRFEGVELFKTVGAWGDYEKKQYKLLRYLKN